ncbi:UDP-3-O-acyl-N-acetylglucosamine deacetylase [Mariprofundus ferrooxydans]|uniref:UDP-3-O-acyl-N-acetylglucosamine deacetylase n=1 Tax=Mariprofundus ferrooxydans PV-1 TaxID=314345 RepID=Q0EYI2_9PROT|nr:UDP-3-O-acyl-N-acetylglucosamine deacetylase [Mariprofundus ferrooxydans]EAU54385.1 UDP-3-O-[3-hydroxymyristoyl] N-acetylglucosamine deacetylase [Mariprofundus ferrooxydans PV-1]KON47399.1 UDP-3-O-(3-hydroxymyristoyl) glucosamine N-acyltransferase [Mariprofundus ferrooxydans]
MIAQRTLDHSIRCSGIGLHSGRKIQLVLHPAPENSGITFVRSDLGVEIPARADCVTDTRLCTTIGQGKANISTVEHLLSALAGLGVDNARIEVSGPEVPIMDGSSAPFVFLIQCAGIREQSQAKKVMRILKRVEVQNGDKRCALYPASGFSVSYLLDYDHPLLRKRKVKIDFSRQAYTREISRARTFGFLHEVEALQKAGLALGGSLENAIVLDTHRVVNEGGLRYEDECVRHKILDTLGDLSLSGYPIVGAFEGELTGHDMNHQLVMTLLADPSSYRIEELQAEKESSAVIAAQRAQTA